jgi:hypothetical protein
MNKGVSDLKARLDYWQEVVKNLMFVFPPKQNRSTD